MNDSPPPADPAATSLRRRFVRTAVRGGTSVVLAGVALSLAIRFTVRDGPAGVPPVYFGTPLVLDALAAAVAALVAWRTGRTWCLVAGAAMAVASGALYAENSFERNEPRAAGTLRGVFWNVEHGGRGWDGVAQMLVRLDPDVAFLAESDDRKLSIDARLRSALPGHTLVRSADGIAVLVRGDAELLRFEKLPYRGQISLFRVAVRGCAITTVFADLGSNLRSRRVPVARVLGAAKPHLGEPLLVVGDFNTPRDSATFDAWRGQLAHAFETAGRGLDATWPTPCPVLAIDHVWAGGGLTIRTCELPWTTASDHLPVVFTFDVP